jgi:hypothetical protein
MCGLETYNKCSSIWDVGHTKEIDWEREDTKNLNVVDVLTV